MDMIFTICGFVAICVMNGSAIPQIIKIVKTHKVKDLHIWRDIMLLMGCSLYLIYAIHKRDIVVITSNVWGVSMFLILIGLQIKHRTL